MPIDLSTLSERERERGGRSGGKPARQEQETDKIRRRKSMMMAYLWTFFAGLRHQFISIISLC